LENDVRNKLEKEFTENILVAHNMDFDKDVLEKSNIKM
jgi:DNA polymerase III alpha subunit (gram-positive type)